MDDRELLMGQDTKIEWAHHTFNPWIGCTKISPACDHCYAAEWDKRYHGGEHWGASAPRRRTSAANWKQPLRWARQARETGERPRVFCASLADVFDNEVLAEWRHDLWRVILDTPELDWLLLTKRIGNVYSMAQASMWANGFHSGMNHSLPANVWLGITVVTQAEADRDIPKLFDVPAAVRFLSCEPLLEEINLTLPVKGCEGRNALTGDFYGVPAQTVDGNQRLKMTVHAKPAVHWVIAGGESGSEARPMHPDWARSLRDQCAAAGVPFFFKQWGEWAPRSSPMDATIAARLGVDPNMACVGKKAAGRLLDGRTHDEVPR